MSIANLENLPNQLLFMLCTHFKRSDLMCLSATNSKIRKLLFTKPFIFFWKAYKFDILIVENEPSIHLSERINNFENLDKEILSLYDKKHKIDKKVAYIFGYMELKKKCESEKEEIDRQIEELRKAKKSFQVSPEVPKCPSLRTIIDEEVAKIENAEGSSFKFKEGSQIFGGGPPIGIGRVFRGYRPIECPPITIFGLADTYYQRAVHQFKLEIYDESRISLITSLNLYEKFYNEKGEKIYPVLVRLAKWYSVHAKDFAAEKR